MKMGLIFDLDGVLVDSAAFHFKAWQRMAESLGIAFDLEANEQLKGLSRARSMEKILSWGSLSMTGEDKARHMAKKNANYLDLVAQLTTKDTLPGAENYLREARRLGHPIALGSASKNAGFILEKVGLMDCFDAIVDGNVVTTSKPDPEVFLTAAKLLKRAPEDCVVFEDAVAGLEAAQRGGMKTIGIGDPSALYADKVVPDLAALGSVSDSLLAFNFNGQDL